MGKLLFLVNPKAGQQKLRAHLLEIIDIFTAGGYEVTVHATQAPGELITWLQTHGSAYDLAVCAGGDGTFNEAATALVTMENPPVLGYIPGGTVNDVGWSLGLSKDPLQAAKDIVEGEPTTIDLGDFGGKRWFAYVAGFGAMTDVSYETPQSGKRRLGRLAYLLKGAKSLFSIRSVAVRMEIDDKVVEEKVIMALVCSTFSVGGFRAGELCDSVSMSDGLWEVVMAKSPRSFRDFACLCKLIFRKKYDPRYFHTVQAKRVKVELPKEVKWTLDGEYGGMAQTVTIENHPRALRVLAPKKNCS